LEDRSPHHVQHAQGNTVTVHDTVIHTQFATQFVTVTAGSEAQCTQAAAEALTTSVRSGSGNQHQQQQQQHQQQQQQHQQAAATHTAPPRMETITKTRVFTTTVMHETPMATTETIRGSEVVYTVTRTVTEHVRQTEVVTSTRLVEETDVVTDHVTQTDDAAATTTTDANVAENTTSSGDAGIADVNTDVVTVTDIETSTFLITTTVDGVVATETGTTTITSDASTATNTDVGGSIADVTTSDSTDTATSTSSAVDPNNTGDNGDPETSLTLDPRVIESNFAQDGQATPTPGQVKSLTSTNNFINFCLTQNVPLTDGKQIRTGSCNVVPQGRIIAKDKIPSAKFVFPTNFGTIPANQQFTAKLKLKNLVAGSFTNANLNYYAAPAEVDGNGVLIGHSHLVIEKINGLGDTEPADPTTFAFFKGLNAALDNEGTLSASVANGLPAGTYRMSSINTASNHMPALASVAQHGSMDDAIYFTAT
jgi:hypothetical protein